MLTVSSTLRNAMIAAAMWLSATKLAEQDGSRPDQSGDAACCASCGSHFLHCLDLLQLPCLLRMGR
jgi:hypothetical protein